MAGVRAMIAPPKPQAPQVSLVRSAATPQDTTDGRWITGFAFAPYNNWAAWMEDACAAHPSDVPGGPGGAEVNAAIVNWVPPEVHEEDRCSAIGYGGRDFVGRATLLLDVATPKAVEAEFWNGAYALANSHPNLWLTKAGLATDLTPASVPSRDRGFEILEQGLADSGFGGRGFIHCRPSEMPNLFRVRREGNLLLTERDTIVVPGSGYPNLGPLGVTGATPAAGQAWMFATGMVEYREGPMNFYPNPGDAGALSQILDKDTNTLVYRVFKPAVAYWDGQVTLACRVTTDA